MIKLNRLTLNNFRFFTDDENNNSFDFDSKNILIYGENGSGKSSIFKAFDFLSHIDIKEDDFHKNKNIFKINDNNTFLEFEFSNKDTLRIDDDHLSLGYDFPFVDKLSISKPLLEYKYLLKITYAEKDEEKNLYDFFSKALENYPIESAKQLKDFKDDDYFEHFQRVIKDELFDNINFFLNKFEQNINITDIKFSGFGKKVYLNLEYFNENIKDYYHIFLNESRLSALAISIYFAIIKKQFEILEENILKILVIDDLLISLDMNNRLNLIDTIKSEFSDFQILFFTHDKALFEIYKDRVNCKTFEIYVKNSSGFEEPFIKDNSDIFTQALEQKEKFNYGCSANLLRQSVEKIICDFLPKEFQLDSKCRKILDLEKLLNSAIRYEKSKDNSNANIIESFEKLKTFKRVILNVASHYSDSNIYKQELNETIEVIEILRK